MNGRGHSSIKSVYQMSLPGDSFLPQKMASESHAKANRSRPMTWMQYRMVFQDCCLLGCEVLFVECNIHQFELYPYVVFNSNDPKSILSALNYFHLRFSSILCSNPLFPQRSHVKVSLQFGTLVPTFQEKLLHPSSVFVRLYLTSIQLHIPEHNIYTTILRIHKSQ